MLINKFINNIYKNLERFSNKYLSVKMQWNLYYRFNHLDKMLAIEVIGNVTSISNDSITMKHISDNKYYPIH